MEKKKYITPETEVIASILAGQFMNWSAPKDEGGNNIPEAREQTFFVVEEEEEYGDILWHDHTSNNLWE